MTNDPRPVGQVVANLRFYIGNLRYNLAGTSESARKEHTKGRLEAYEDASQMLTGSRSKGEDIK